MTGGHDVLLAWLAGLAGYEPGHEDTQTRRVGDRAAGASLRLLLLDRIAQREQAVPWSMVDSEASQWRLVRSQLVGVPASLALAEPTGCAPAGISARALRARSAANQSRWLLVACMFALALLLPWALRLSTEADGPVLDDYRQGVVLRGGRAPQRLLVSTTADASALCDRIEQLLRANQSSYRRIALGQSSCQIQAALEAGGQALQVLKQEGVSVPPSGLVDLHVVVAPTPGEPAADDRSRP